MKFFQILLSSVIFSFDKIVRNFNRVYETEYTFAVFGPERFSERDQVHLAMMNKIRRLEATRNDFILILYYFFKMIVFHTLFPVLNENDNESLLKISEFKNNGSNKPYVNFKPNWSIFN